MSHADAQSGDRDSRVLAELPRGHEELRVSIDEYKGHRYVGLRVFYQAGDGSWRPSPKKGCSIRAAEITDVVEALMSADEILN